MSIAATHFIISTKHMRHRHTGTGTLTSAMAPISLQLGEQYGAKTAAAQLTLLGYTYTCVVLWTGCKTEL